VPDWDITGPKRPAQAPSDEPSATTLAPPQQPRQALTNPGPA
jgi:hypothetical protein